MMSILNPKLVECLETVLSKHFEHDLVLKLFIVIRDTLGCSPNVNNIRACAIDHLFCIVHVVAKVEKVEPIYKVNPAHNLVCIEHKQDSHLDYAGSEAAQK